MFAQSLSSLFHSGLVSPCLGTEDLVSKKRRDQRICRSSKNAPPKNNLGPENHGLEDDVYLLGMYSQVPC